MSCWNNPYPPEQSPVPFRSDCDYNIEQTPPPSKMSMCKWWRHSGEGWEDLYQRHQNNSQSIHAALHSPICTSPFASLPLSPPQRHRWARGSCSSSPLKSQIVREYWIIVPPLLWVVGEWINLVLVNSSRSSCRRCNRIIRASPCMFCSWFVLSLLGVDKLGFTTDFRC